MTVTIACSRPMPVPETMELGGQDVRFVPVGPDGVFPTDARAYLTTAMDPVGDDLIAAMPDRLGLIASLGVGFDHIDRAAAARRALQIANTPVVTDDTADLAFALILSAARRVGASERYVRAGSWTMDDQPPPMGTSVHGATLGLIGFGAIGQAVARRAAGFGMNLLYHGPNEKRDAAQALGASYRADIGDLMADADIVSVHAPYDATTHGLIGAAELARCKAGAVFVNTSRGALVDEDALIAALRDGTIAAAGLDVFVHEPAVPDALLAMEQVVLTPHIGSATTQCRIAMMQRALANIAQYLATGTVMDPVPAH